jgi:hypothetical protein
MVLDAEQIAERSESGSGRSLSWYDLDGRSAERGGSERMGGSLMSEGWLEYSIAEQEPYVSLRHLVWHIIAVMQSLDRMDDESELKSLGDLRSRMLQIAEHIEADIRGPVRS